MAPMTNKSMKKQVNRGAWTAEEDQKLTQVIEIHGPKRWKSVAAKAGIDRCGKSCRLRWMNYLRPNIKRGNISDQEEDLILRLHKLLGNRWSLIAGRLPGRTDNEIKNYWNSHLSKKIKKMEKHSGDSTVQGSNKPHKARELEKENMKSREEGSSIGRDHKESSKMNFNVDEFFDFSNDGPLNLEWVSKFLEVDEAFCGFFS